MTYEEIQEAVANGARFMVFPYVISLFITFERYSEVRLVRPGCVSPGVLARVLSVGGPLANNPSSTRVVAGG